MACFPGFLSVIPHYQKENMMKTANEVSSTNQLSPSRPIVIADGSDLFEESPEVAIHGWRNPEAAGDDDEGTAKSAGARDRQKKKKK
jgi:hypothetical protein